MNNGLLTCKKSVKTLFIFWITFLLGLELNFIDKLLIFRTNCAPLVADLFCYERDFTKSLSRENQADIIEAFNSTSRYLDDLLNIDQMVDRIYPTELQLNKANASDIKASFFGFLMVQFPPKLMINGTVLILI